MLDERIDRMTQEVRQLNARLGSTKAAAIMAGAGANYDGPATPFLKAMMEARTRGDPESHAYLKAVLGTSAATGQAIIPNNFVAGIVDIASAANVWRRVLNVVTGIGGKAVDLPYEVTGTEAAMLQGGAAQSYGSNKDVRDFTVATATATLYTIAEIIDLGNQFLRQSEGAAENLARRRLGKAFAKGEAQFINNGTGTNQPLGFFPAINAYGAAPAITTTLTSEPRAATFGRAIGALEARGQTATALVCHPTDYWETATEGLGTSYAGGWAIAPAEGPSSSDAQATMWGVPIFRDPFWPAAKVGTALVLNAAEIDLYFGQEYRIDISSDGGNRFDQNVTGFRGEEELGFNAEPAVRTGHVQIVAGI
jgi:HK97 family phage major capsid protein